MDNFSEEARSYELPDERIIQIDAKTRYRCTEALFKLSFCCKISPSIIGQSCFSIPEMMCDSLNRCDTDLQQELMRNIVLGGGSSMFKGLLPRLQKDILKQLPKVLSPTPYPTRYKNQNFHMWLNLNEDSVHGQADQCWDL